ncbi:hypothetical protein [Mycobacterium sp.]|uniref:hypothetical protein n=1 Tax=Mycobacterium sp. TaxID=1785 RepID=UPI002BBE91CE|nr:hypothetical protein [Mycobacterium sp.]HKP41576.1 hypothetical protein [Mycobacterium sp.]
MTEPGADDGPHGRRRTGPALRDHDPAGFDRNDSAGWLIRTGSTPMLATVAMPRSASSMSAPTRGSGRRVLE